jgi:hypothetical protein
MNNMRIMVSIPKKFKNKIKIIKIYKIKNKKMRKR